MQNLIKKETFIVELKQGVSQISLNKKYHGYKVLSVRVDGSQQNTACIIDIAVIGETDTQLILESQTHAVDPSSFLPGKITSIIVSYIKN